MMRTLILAAATFGVMISMANSAAAGPFDGERCVPTRTGNGKSILVCGKPIHRAGMPWQRTCTQVYNTYTRRFEQVCR